jgi:Ni/Co efflux regulator RcnB
LLTNKFSIGSPVRPHYSTQRWRIPAAKEVQAMRKAIAFILLAATATTPLMAQQWGTRDGNRDQGRPEAQPNRGDGQRGPSAGAPGQGRDRVYSNPYRGRDGNGVPGNQGYRGDGRAPGEDRGPRDRDGYRRPGTPGGPGAPGIPGDRGGPDRRDWRDGRDGPDRRDFRDDRGPRGAYNNYRGDNRGWNNGWRNDRRYDWQGYRAQNRNIYRAPRYAPPRGYAGQYRRWSPGFRVDPYLYGRSYWISDPWQYRLPPAYGDYRWVRYYDDVALVDVRSGIIADIIYSFFYR